MSLKERYHRPNLYQMREIAMLLTFIGGFIDSYTYVLRGHVLAASQTGNIIFLSVNLANHNLPGALVKICSLISFVIGVGLVTLLNLRFKVSNYWRLATLFPGIVTCIIVGMLPANTSDVIIIGLLSLSMSMQTTSFSMIEGQAYNNVFSTGNLKKAIISLSYFIYNHDRDKLNTFLLYIELVFCFAIGALVSAILQKEFNLHTIWIAAFLQFLVAIWYAVIINWRENYQNKQRK